MQPHRIRATFQSSIFFQFITYGSLGFVTVKGQQTTTALQPWSSAPISRSGLLLIFDLTLKTTQNILKKISNIFCGKTARANSFG
jgi:hypothetical protein